MTKADNVDFLFRILEEQGQGDYIGERISQLEHCLQTAHFAEQAGADNDTIVAALLHDIGQFIPYEDTKKLLYKGENVGRVGHDTIGEEHLRRMGFKDKVCRLVGAHVVAKRYLTGTDQVYYEGLSNASKKSLKVQGGPFTPELAREFEEDPLWREKVQLRKWDDAAKLEDYPVNGLSHYRAIVEEAIQ